MSRRRAIARVVFLALTVAAASCAPVKPYQRELLAKPMMTFHQDPDEETLDLHMLEAREGSSGGYGSSGGGCGCN